MNLKPLKVVSATITLCFLATLLLAPSCKAQGILGDANGDGVVNIFDIVLIKANWGESVATNPFSGDVNNDGVVNILDIVLVTANWGNHE